MCCWFTKIHYFNAGRTSSRQVTLNTCRTVSNCSTFFTIELSEKFGPHSAGVLWNIPSPTLNIWWKLNTNTRYLISLADCTPLTGSLCHLIVLLIPSDWVTRRFIFPKKSYAKVVILWFSWIVESEPLSAYVRITLWTMKALKD